MTPAAIEIHKKLCRLLQGALNLYEKLIQEWEKDLSR